jgi:signal transduction histidine kinase/CheY-like chemotaxis protein
MVPPQSGVNAMKSNMRGGLEGWISWIEERAISSVIRGQPDLLRRARLLLWFNVVTLPIGLALFGVAGSMADRVHPVLILNLLAFAGANSSVIFLRWRPSTLLPSLASSVGLSVVLGCGMFLGGGLQNVNTIFLAMVPLFYGFAGGLFPAACSSILLSLIVTGFYALESNGYVFQEVVPQSNALAYICIIWALISALGLAWFNERLVRGYLSQLEGELAQRKSIEVSLRDSEALKDEFLAYLGHEIRNPMASIFAAADMLAMPEFEEKRGHYLSVLRRSANSLRDLLDHVLDFSMIESGNIVLNSYSFSLGELVAELRADFELQATKKGLQFRLELDDSLPDEIVADRVRLRQILFNLLSNAVKYTESGEVKFIVAQAADGIRFGVRDSGVGIPAEIQSEVLKPYVQASSPVRGRGIGLGLPISDQLITLMGGALHLESNFEGSLFEFTLCFTGASTDLPMEVWRERVNPNSVLVAEDNDAFRDILSEMLVSQGFHVSQAVNGQEAVDKSRRHEVDLIIMDLNMPVKDGFQAAKQIRADEARPGVSPVKILAITGNQSKGLERRCREAGIDRMLQKPVTANTLKMTVQVLLEEKANS